MLWSVGGWLAGWLAVCVRLSHSVFPPAYTHALPTQTRVHQPHMDVPPEGADVVPREVVLALRLVDPVLDHELSCCREERVGVGVCV